MCLLLDLQARNRRLATNWLTQHRAFLEELAEEASWKKDTWKTWNPQREAGKQLEEAVKSGVITLQVRARGWGGGRVWGMRSIV